MQKLIDEAVPANVIKSVIFNSKVVHRIFRIDSVADDTVMVSKTQEGDGNEEHNVGTVILEESLTLHYYYYLFIYR